MRALGKTIHAYAGHTVLTSWPGTPPRGTTSTWTDPLVGVIAALAALAGRVQARRTGAGAYFDLSMAEATIAVLVEPFLEFLNTGHEPQPRGNTVEEWCPHNTYPCADGRWIASAAHTQAEWQALCAAVGMPAALATLAGAAQRNAHRAEIDSVLDRWCHARDANDAVLQLRAHGVCAVLVQSFQEWLESEHVASRDLVGAIVDDDGQRHPVIKLPWVEDPRPPFRYAAPPRIGEHTSQVLTDILGASHAEIAGWTEAGALT
jgi:crotonobetainyl-CoA:carnitine CoA-transferase CaiB-like acyl-CoA transferase